MKAIYITFLMISFLTLATAQGNETALVTGTVRNPDGGPAAGAEIGIICDATAEKPFLGSADEDGRFEIRTPDSNCRIKALKMSGGITRFSKEREIRPGAGGRTTVTLSLTESARIREEVDVRIASGTAQPFSEVAKTVSVIDKEEITARNEISVGDAIRVVPGFRVQQLGGPGRTASVKARGLRNQDTAVLIDGQRIRDPGSITGDASAFISDLTLVNVERIEVLRGSGSSVYGTNAIGGVIDIQTQKPAAGIDGRLFGEYGGLGYSRYQGTGSYGTDDGRFGVSGGVSRFRLSEGIDGEDDADNAALNVRLTAAPIEKLSLFGRAYVSDAFVRLNSNPDTLGPPAAGEVINAIEGVNFARDANDPDSLQRTDLFSGSLGGSYALSSRTVLSASYHGLDTSRENENGPLGPGFQPFGGTQFSLFDGRIHTFNTKLDWSPFDNGRLIAGYEFEIEKYANEGIGPAAQGAFRTEVDQRSRTFFTQYLASFLEKRLQIAGGFRLQAFRLSSPDFSVANAPYSGVRLENPPRAVTYDGAVSYFFPRTATKLRFHAGNGYRVPSLYERFGSFYSSFSQSFTAIGDPGLEPERSVAFDAGIDQVLFRGRAELSATYFYTRLTDTIGYANVAPDIGTTQRPFGGYENTKGGLARGLELSSRLNPFESTSLFVSYTYTNSDQRRPQVLGSGIIESLGIPSSRVTLVVTQTVGSRLTVNFDFEATGAYLAPIFSNTSFSTQVYRFDGNRRGDLTATYRLPLFGERTKVVFFTTVENVFGHAYYENGFATAGRTARAGVGLSF